MRDRSKVRCEAGDKYGIILLGAFSDGSHVREAVRTSKCLQRLLPCLTIQHFLEEVSTLLLGKSLNRDLDSDFRDSNF